jgi:trk system potassium uptake protein TrkA
VLVSLTGVDELNIIISLYGRTCGVPQIITKLGRMGNRQILNNLDIGSTISPKELCCNNIIRYVRAIKDQTGAAIALHTIADGQAEAIEFLVDNDTQHCNEALKNLTIKQNVLIVCIVRSGYTRIPNGDSSFRKGDTVIIVTSRQEVIYQLNDIFE